MFKVNIRMKISHYCFIIVNKNYKIQHQSVIFFFLKKSKLVQDHAIPFSQRRLYRLYLQRMLIFLKTQTICRVMLFYICIIHQLKSVGYVTYNITKSLSHLYFTFVTYINISL